MPTHLYIFLTLLLLGSCQSNEIADTIFVNGHFYTVETESLAQTLVVKDGRILAVGDSSLLPIYKGRETEVIDLNRKFVMPGFIEGHAHLTNLGYSLGRLQFLDDQSWEEIVHKIEQKAQTLPSGEWILGRGWHQEKWDSLPPNHVKGYPRHDELSQRVPNHPVLITHASGHAIFANQKAMELAGISTRTVSPPGGRIIRDEKGEAIGVFEENAENLIESALEEYEKSQGHEARYHHWKRAIRKAETACLKYGITSFQDAGTSLKQLDYLYRYAESEGLRMRLWIMMYENLENLKQSNRSKPVIDTFDQYLTVGGIKGYMDGALGSRGAWLIEPYTDDSGNTGQIITPIDSLEEVANFARQNGWQFCVHAIGDRANREVLDMYHRVWDNEAVNTDHRWRIEHAQHIHPEDIPRFDSMGIIPAMQAIHCASDAPFVIDRLGFERAKNTSYRWRTLIDSGSIIANGTDAPVESVNPFESIYASITRKKLPADDPFFPEESMTRVEALKSYTIWNAHAVFQETDKGTLAPGKLADFVVLSNNLLECAPEEILNTNVLATYISGQKVYPFE